MKKVIFMLSIAMGIVALNSCGESAAEKASKKAEQVLNDGDRIKDSINGNEQPAWYYEDKK